MPSLSPEWAYWALVNGVLGSGLVFALLIPALRKQYPWTVAHTQSAIFLVTGFLMRGAIFGHIVVAANWGQIRWIVLGTTVYGLILLAASMIYGDLFHWKRFLAIMWFILYLEEPVWMLTLVPNSEALVAASGVLALPGDPLNSLLIAVLWIQAAVLAIAGLPLLFDWNTEKIWPWRPDRVSGMVISGFPIGWALWSATLAGLPWPEAKIGLQINLVWLALVFLSLLIFRRTFDFSLRSTRVFTAVSGLLLLGVAVGYLVQT
jgi:hypothetical protein